MYNLVVSVMCKANISTDENLKYQHNGHLQHRVSSQTGSDREQLSKVNQLSTM